MEIIKFGDPVICSCGAEMKVLQRDENNSSERHLFNMYFCTSCPMAWTPNVLIDDITKESYSLTPNNKKVHIIPRNMVVKNDTK